MLLLATSLLFTDPLPLDMPRAEAYLAREGGRVRLEDRYNAMDLWVSHAVDGRWMDEDGRIFVLARLDVAPPALSARESSVTRMDSVAGRVPVDRRDKKAVRTAVEALSPVPVPEKEARPRQLPRGFKDVDYWHGTNTSTIVCAFLPEKSGVWRLATWQLVEGDDFYEALEVFEDELFGEVGRPYLVTTAGEAGAAPRRGSSKKKAPALGERELLRADVRHSVAAYDDWRFTDTPEFVVIDDLDEDSSFIAALTNDLPVMRAKYLETMPTGIDGSNVLCSARIYSSRSEYLDAMEAEGLTNMAWSAAYWCQQRREIVACRPPAIFESSSDAELLRTFRHEAFHQYLSYASSMMAVSPWLNEGYAQYFEEGPSVSERVPSKADWGADGMSPDDLKRVSEMLPALLAMDYREFYDGTDEARRFKYRLALSIALFIEHGAKKVRFDPFKDLKRRYFKALFENGDMREATSAAFESADGLKLFVAEWLKFWKNT